ncbi:MAG: hypothetical protein ACXV5B_03695 [Halobacteriota archaeon]
MTRAQLEKVWPFFMPVRLDERQILRPSDTRSFEQLCDTLRIQKDRFRVSGDGETFVILALAKPSETLLANNIVLCSGPLSDKRAIDLAAMKFGIELEVTEGRCEINR